MTVSPTRDVTQVPPIPRPRAAEPEIPAVAERPADGAPELPAARYPWPEPWRSARGARPRSEFWDVATACWQSSGPQPRGHSKG